MNILTDLTSSWDLIQNLTQREIKGKYKRTVLGQAWSLLNPIALMATYSIVFAFVLKAKPSAGDPSGLDIFALWLACALLPWIYFNNILVTGMSTLVGNANLIQKVYFPREVLVIANALSWLFTFSIEMVVLVAAVLLFGGTPLLYIPGVVFFMLVLTVFALGISLLLSVANVYFRDTQHFVAIGMQLLFYATPIVYPVSLVAKSHPGIVAVYRLNPMERFSEVFRNLIYDGRWPTVANTLSLVGTSVVALVFGYIVFRRFEGRLAEEL